MATIDLDADLHGSLRQLREQAPVVWFEPLHGWLATTHAAVNEALRDWRTFTVDDPRFSTARVLGPSMLSRDGAEHARHRAPFVEPFRAAEVRARFVAGIDTIVRRHVAALAPRRRAELRTEFAGPVAADVMRLALALTDVSSDDLLAWYRDIVGAVADHASARAGRDPSDAVARLGDRVRAAAAGPGVLGEARATLAADEVVSNAAVMLFGGLETGEGQIANLIHDLLAADRWSDVHRDRSLLAAAVDESLRHEPAVVRLDRFAARATELAGIRIGAGDFVMLSISAANRDPALFHEPDLFDLRRENARLHLTFAVGTHACPGMHLARAELTAALSALLDACPALRVDPDGRSAAPSGTVFRKPPRLDVVWD